MIDRVTFAAHHLCPAAGAVRGGHAAHRRRARAACRDRLCRRHRARCDPRARDRAGRAQAREALGAAQQRPPVRPGGLRRHRQLRGRGGASARRRHHIGRSEGRDPRRPPLRAAADGRARASPATARASFGVYNGAAGCRRAGPRDRTSDEDFRMSERRSKSRKSTASRRRPRRGSRMRPRRSSASATISKASSRRSRRAMPPASRAASCTKRSSRR